MHHQQYNHNLSCLVVLLLLLLCFVEGSLDKATGGTMVPLVIWHGMGEWMIQWIDTIIYVCTINGSVIIIYTVWYIIMYVTYIIMCACMYVLLTNYVYMYVYKMSTITFKTRV